jgi:hypothetical protein
MAGCPPARRWARCGISPRWLRAGRGGIDSYGTGHRPDADTRLRGCAEFTPAKADHLIAAAPAKRAIRTGPRNIEAARCGTLERVIFLAPSIRTSSPQADRAPPKSSRFVCDDALPSTLLGAQLRRRS